MKKLLVLVLVLLLVAGCSAKDDKTAMHKIGVLQMMTHDALDSDYQGFKDALKDRGYIEGENIVFDYQNPNNDASSMATMANALVNSEPELIMAIGTAAAQSLSLETDTIPILGSAITDYVDTGLADSNEKPGRNISGCSDFMNMQTQMDLVEALVPDVKTIGLLYSSSEENSYIQAVEMKDECAKRNWTVIEKTISDLTMVNDTMMAFVGNVDALYIPTDNPLASSMASVVIVSEEYDIPVITGWDGGVKDGALASVGVNYYNLGYKTGEYAADLIEGKVTISELPIYFMDHTIADIYYNSNTATKINLELSSEITEKGIDLAQ